MDSLHLLTTLKGSHLKQQPRAKTLGHSLKGKGAPKTVGGSGLFCLVWSVFFVLTLL
jgi:hypothetical protein